MKNRYLRAEMNMTKQAMEINYVDRLKLTGHHLFFVCFRYDEKNKTRRLSSSNENNMRNSLSVQIYV